VIHLNTRKRVALERIDAQVYGGRILSCPSHSASKRCPFLSNTLPARTIHYWPIQSLHSAHTLLTNPVSTLGSYIIGQSSLYTGVINIAQSRLYTWLIHFRPMHSSLSAHTLSTHPSDAPGAANMAQTRQSRPDSGLGSPAKALKPSQGVPFPGAPGADPPNNVARSAQPAGARWILRYPQVYQRCPFLSNTLPARTISGQRIHLQTSGI
jgi:hypothetical protein